MASISEMAATKSSPSYSATSALESPFGLVQFLQLLGSEDFFYLLPVLIGLFHVIQSHGEHAVLERFDLRRVGFRVLHEVSEFFSVGLNGFTVLFAVLHPFGPCLFKLSFLLISQIQEFLFHLAWMAKSVFFWFFLILGESIGKDKTHQSETEQQRENCFVFFRFSLLVFSQIP